ncbi:MAG: SRPBCC family protein [Myxococcota bacterium]|nr:SRPBCC family protein [Myxococcota bacterium]
MRFLSVPTRLPCQYLAYAVSVCASSESQVPMDIQVVTSVPFPMDDVYHAMRDQMPALAEFMPNIASIQVESRDDDSSGEVRLVNRWTAAATEIPVVARGMIDPSNVYWLDHAHWKSEPQSCHWRLEMGFMSDRVQCQGITRYIAQGPSTTQMEITGTLELNLKGLVPRLLIGKVTAGVERFVGKLVEPNFQKTADALAAYLDSQAKA